MRARRFVVISEEYEAYHATEVDPPECGCDVWEGEAKNSSQARLLAMKEWLAMRRSSALDNRSDGLHPMHGARVLEVMPCERHQNNTCEMCISEERGDKIIATEEMQKAAEEQEHTA